MNSEWINLLTMMADRLERLNVDSKWARRASGTRGEVIKALENSQQGKMQSQEELDNLIAKSMDLLSRAARDIPDVDSLPEQGLKER